MSDHNTSQCGEDIIIYLLNQRTFFYFNGQKFIKTKVNSILNKNYSGKPTNEMFLKSLVLNFVFGTTKQ